MTKKFTLIIFVIMILSCMPQLAKAQGESTATVDQERLRSECLDLKHGVLVQCLQKGLKALQQKPDDTEEEEVYKWSAPKEMVNKENPFIGDESSINKGKIFFKQNCVVCHGEVAGGDGPLLKELGIEGANLTHSRIKDLTDGELMYRITEGGWPMPAFGYQAEWGEDELWHVINFLRLLSKTE